MLSGGDYRIEDAVNIGHVEIATHQKVARPPIVSAQEGMDITYSTFPGSAVAEMAHIYLT